jgi:hypothetical protein
MNRQGNVNDQEKFHVSTIHHRDIGTEISL